MVQLCCYTELLSVATGVQPVEFGIVMVSSRSHLKLTGEVLDLRKFRTSDYWFYYLKVKEAFLRLMADFSPDMLLRPIPNARSDHARWQSIADSWFEETDHLSRVAGITVGQIKKLESGGITSLATLGGSLNAVVPRLANETRNKLVRQARIQLETRELRALNPVSSPAFELLPREPGVARGLAA
jgi:hypothetical protein